jgi:hypothetical protein
VPPITDSERRRVFEHYLGRALTFGECHESTCEGITREMWTALQQVADERTAESVAAARSAYEDEVTSWYEFAAVRRAVEAGEIPREQNTSEYHPEMLTFGAAQLDAARAWLEANRMKPGEIYRSMVLEQPR